MGNKLLNKVIIQGELVNGSFGKSNDHVFFAQIKQERKMINFTWIDYFSIYALSPLSNKLAEIMKTNPNSTIIIEGELHTKITKPSNEVKMRILVNKIVDVSSIENTQTK